MKSTVVGRNGRAAHGTRGFTLIELMVVIVILGALMALVGPNVYRYLTDGTRAAAKAQIGNLSSSIDLFAVKRRSLPRDLEDLTLPPEQAVMGHLPIDPWGEAYGYRVVDPRLQEYEVWSIGEDRLLGTDDDLVFNSRAGFRDRAAR